MLRALGRIVAYTLGIVVLAAVVGGVYQALTWPDVRRLAAAPPESTAFIDRYREDQRLSGAADSVAWQWVPDTAISAHLARAVLAAEDLEFFSHNGFSTHEIRAAVRAALEEGKRLRGASTITQQLAKNLWLSPSRNPWRKVKEVILTWQLERYLTKRRILELYVNVVEFGRGIYGAEAAASFYFAKPAAALSEAEAAMLAASLPRPLTWNPYSESGAYAEYVAVIRERMDRATFLWRHLEGTPVDPRPATVPSLDTIAVPQYAPPAPGQDSTPPDTGRRSLTRHDPDLESSWAS